MAKTLEEHLGYLSDGGKVARYRAAVGQTVQPGHVVVDLGCGPGLLGLMALEAGAGKVFFVEEGQIIEVARRTVASAGYDDKAEFFKANSFELTLPEPADVIICDHVGYFGFDYGILALLADAKARFLKDDGNIIPGQIDLELAPVESEPCRNLVGQWHDGSSVPGEFAWLAATAANTKHAMQLRPNELLAETQTLGTLELGAEVAPFLTFGAEFRCARDGTLDGVAGFFDCRLAGGIQMTNSPAAEDAISRPQAYLPLESPVPVAEGDVIRATIMARPLDYIIAWVIELPRTGQRFDHTTFNGMLLDQETLAQAQPDRIAALNDQGRAMRILLSYCDGERTIAEVQEQIQREHPDLFPSGQATLSFLRRNLAWVTGE